MGAPPEQIRDILEEQQYIGDKVTGGLLCTAEHTFGILTQNAAIVAS